MDFPHLAKEKERKSDICADSEVDRAFLVDGIKLANFFASAERHFNGTFLGVARDGRYRLKFGAGTQELRCAALLKTLPLALRESVEIEDFFTQDEGEEGLLRLNMRVI